MQSGADDYVTKPFDIKEVLARVAVQIRRMEGSFSEGNLVYQGLELDRENFCVRVDQTELPKITRQEFSILELLLKHPKKVFSKEEIFEYAWEEAYMGETKMEMVGLTVTMIIVGMLLREISLQVSE